MERGRKLRVKLSVMTRGQRLPTSNGFTASHTYCSFYNIFPPLPQQSTIEKALRMVQVQRAKALPGVSDSPLALQITVQRYSKNKLESPNCPPLPYKGPDEKNSGKKAKEIHLLGDVINAFVCNRAFVTLNACAIHCLNFMSPSWGPSD